MKKIIIGLIASLPFIISMGIYNYQLLLESKVIIIFLIGVIASYYQADYNPLKSNNGDNDKGTVLQIIWSVYISQALALLEAFFINKERAFAYDTLSYLFLAVAIFGLIFRSWAYISLGRFFTMHLETRNDQTLIDNGPYRFLRHPSYTGAFLTYTFIPLFLTSYIAAILSAIILLFAFYRRINLEEKMLTDHMGNKYLDFCKKRYRLLPFIW